MTKLKVPQIWLCLWFLLLYFWAVASSVHVLTFNLNAIIQGVPQLKPCRNLLCILMTMILIFLDFYFDSDVPIHLQMANRLVCCVIFNVTCITMLKYGVRRILVDYHFVYESKLSIGWENLIKVSILLNLTFSVLSAAMIVMTTKDIEQLVYFAVILSPVVIFMLLRMFKCLLKVR